MRKPTTIIAIRGNEPFHAMIVAENISVMEPNFEEINPKNYQIFQDDSVYFGLKVSTKTIDAEYQSYEINYDDIIDKNILLVNQLRKDSLEYLINKIKLYTIDDRLGR